MVEPLANVPTAPSTAIQPQSSVPTGAPTVGATMVRLLVCAGCIASIEDPCLFQPPTHLVSHLAHAISRLANG